MGGLAFLATCVAVIWLALWVVRDPQARSGASWPFDLAGPDKGTPDRRRSARTSQAPVPPWRRSRIAADTLRKS